MYEEAVSLSSSILKGIFGNVETLGDHQLLDMLESAGMVLVQSLHGLGRYIFQIDDKSFLFLSYFRFELDALRYFQSLVLFGSVIVFLHNK